MKQIEITSNKSLVHLGSLDSFDITEGGKTAARHILTYLENKDTNELESAIKVYENLIPNENFGGEYTALQWLCKFLLTPEPQQAEMRLQPSIDSFYRKLSDNNFENLIKYINLKYHFVEIKRGDDDTRAFLRFLEDFILFNNPDRMRWEKTEENMQKFQIRSGMSVADVGSGPGYFTFKFSDIVGTAGKVYAIETNPRHIEFLNEYINKYSVSNVEVVTSSFDGIGLSPDVHVDIVYMCSLYHNVYAAFTDEERDSFVGSIRHALNDNGRLIIVDNDLVNLDEELPYHGPYISRDLIVSQLWFYGFELEMHYQFTPQRYVLIFQKVPRDDSKIDHIPAKFHDDNIKLIDVCSAASLIRYRIIGSLTSGYTHKGKSMALLMYKALEEHDMQLLEKAKQLYLESYSLERIGDDYTALLWFCQTESASDAEKQAMLAEPINREYYEFFTANDYDILKQYLKYKYDFAVPLPREGEWDTLVHDYTGDEIKLSVLNDWSEYLTFINPNRNMWEMTDKMIETFDIKPDEHIADIGCGSGYFSYIFAKAANRGKVYATEINADALSYVTKLSEKYSLNIEAKVSKLNDICIEENSVDTVFMCSMYHAVYIASIEFVKDEFIASVKKALRKGGRLLIVDNDITPRSAPPYYGSGIAKELVISQLSYYGFELVSYKQFIPQRFILEFRLNDEEL